MKGLFAVVAFIFGIQSLFSETVTQTMQLQLADENGAPVENTQFSITVEMIINNHEITLNLPTINFQVGQCAADDPDCSSAHPRPGYIITTGGFLPPDLRPNSLVPITIYAASGDGLAQTGTGTLPTPPSGFIVLIDNAGGLTIQQAGISQNALAAGPHIVLPSSVTFQAGKMEDNICFNFALSQGQIDVTQFTDPVLIGNYFRDSHVNDAFDNTFAWAWTDNHNAAANIMNVFVAVGKIDKKGRLKLGNPIQLTNLPSGTMGWDTSVAINRQNKNNIVVSYGVTHAGSSQSARAVSFDGGKTWGGVFDGTNSLPYNGLINYQTPPSSFGDIPGVSADQYGNFWYAIRSVSPMSQPYLLISTDSGVTWNLAFEFPTVAEHYDYPHLVFGGNGSGQYGIWYYADYFDSSNNIYPAISFIPITGFGSYGAGTSTFLNVFPNAIFIPTIAASNSGSFWALGYPLTSNLNYNLPLVALFKSPGAAIDQNYSGPWLVGSQNRLNSISTNIFQFNSAPGNKGYIISVQGLIYDESRQALYGLFSASYPPLSQNMPLYFAISRNNGQTWSAPYQISTSSFANRGFSSMSLDSASGNLYLGWYDGRKDPATKNLQYYGGIIPAQKLNKMVNQIPYSNPVYTITGQGTTTPP